MQNFDKTYLPTFDVSVNRPNSIKRIKIFFWQALPLIFKFVSVGLVLLVFQILLVGVFDRIGVSPKISLIGSSLFYVAFFGGLAIIGGLKSSEISEVLETNLKNQPICKMLIIKRKSQEIKL